MLCLTNTGRKAACQLLKYLVFSFVKRSTIVVGRFFWGKLAKFAGWKSYLMWASICFTMSSAESLVESRTTASEAAFKGAMDRLLSF